MLDNHIYNLMAQLVEEHRSLWRIKEMYQNDAGDCSTCQVFWKKMIDDKEEHVSELQGLIKNHI